MKVVRLEQGTFITVNFDEATRLIASLACQMGAGNSNTGRAESIDEDGKAFTIFVVQEPEGR